MKKKHRYNFITVMVTLCVFTSTYVGWPIEAFGEPSDESTDEAVQVELGEDEELHYEPSPFGGGGIINIEDKMFGISDDSESSTSGRDLEASYDPRSTSSVQVKNQGYTGLCWAFSTVAAAERSMEAGGASYNALSPAHLGYFFYNRQNDPLGNTAGDKNIANESGYDYASLGGNNLFTIQALAGWMGVAPNSLTSGFSYYSWSGYTFDDTTAYDNDAILANAEILQSDNDVKSAIKKHGSVAAAYYHYNVSDSTNPYYNTSTGAYCYINSNPYSNYSNHAITIVGWDDNYDKNNFNEKCRPENNGAWLVQNSWGSYWANSGYFYISYEDTSLCNAIAMEFVDDSTYDYNYQYDGNAYSYDTYLYKGDEVANVFRVPEDSGLQQLEAVGVTSWSASNYKIEIYTGVEASSGPTASAQEPQATAYLTSGNAGFYTVKLDEPVTLIPGEYYSIVMTAQTATYIGLEKEYTNSSVWINFACETQENQSYIRRSGEDAWSDLHNQGVCVRIKGFASDMAENTGDTDIASVISGVEIAGYGEDYTYHTNYNGSNQEPNVVVNSTSELENGTDYYVVYSNNINAGIAKVIIYGIGDYKGQVVKEFIIDPIALPTITWPSGSYTYTGSAIKPKVTVNGLTEGKDFTVAYENNINPGTATIKVTGKGNYTDTYTHTNTFTISRINIANKSISLAGTSYSYTGSALQPAVSISGLVKNKDYTVSYTNNVYPGTAKVTIAGIGRYTGTVTKNFTISKANQYIAGGTLFNKTYGNVAFNLGASANGKLTYQSSNSNIATVSGTGRIAIKNTGQATITIRAAATGTHNAAVKKVTINVSPKKTAGVKAKASGKKKAAVSWKRDKNATGYQIVYSMDKSFRTNVKTVNIGKNKTVKKTVSKLKSKKTYYVKVRAYKKVGSVKLYGPYSSVKKVKIK